MRIFPRGGKAGIVILLVSSLLPPAEAADGWQRIKTPLEWERQQGGRFEDLDGHAWYRCFVKIPDSWRGRKIALDLGRVYDCDETFLNGVRVGATGSMSPYRNGGRVERSYELESRLVHFGRENLIAIHVYDAQGAGGIARGPVMLSSSAGVIVLAGDWQFRVGNDASWANWPVSPDSEEAGQLVEDFRRGSGPDLGRLVEGTPLPGTRHLGLEGDLASHIVAGVDSFLLGKIEQSRTRRASHWKRDTTSIDSYTASVEPRRQRLARIIGAHDERVSFGGLEYLSTTEVSAQVGESDTFEAFAVRWPVIGDMHGEGLLLLPRGREPVADVVAIPDADQTPEMICGLVQGVEPASQFARRLAESGCRVVVPVLVDRGVTYSTLSNREFLYRSAFELGRHLIGYEVQKVRAVVDWFRRSASPERRVGVIGWGEGGLLALYSAALDTRIDAATVSAYFEPREGVWQEPVYRNVFGLLDEFGDAEIASLVAPRSLIIEAARGPELVVPEGTRGAPGRLRTPPLGRVKQEIERARQLISGLEPAPVLKRVVSGGRGVGPEASPEALAALLEELAAGAELAALAEAPRHLRRDFDSKRRQAEQIREIDRHNQWLLRESPFVRRKFLEKLDTSSLERYGESVEWYREYFRDEVVGQFDDALLPANPRSRRILDEDDFDGYALALDVFPDVIAYGILLLPKDLQPGERRPVVVCQHGLEGRPRDVADPRVYNGAYHQYAVQLTRRGLITFSPQNLYIFRDRFRTLQRKANPLKKTLFSVIVPQHQQIVDWLAAQEWTDPERIAFYGLSYGGKSAMRIPPLVDRYCLSICSADFNEWVDKNASTRNPRSYVWMGEYEIFEWDLGSTFNYMEMAALIAPRPFMVERGHFDGVADDENVAYEFAKVRNLYAARLKIPDRCKIEWFDGPHTINGKGTFDFLHRHLDWPKPD